MCERESERGEEMRAPVPLINRVNGEAPRSAIRIQHVKECERGEEFPSFLLSRRSSAKRELSLLKSEKRST